MLSEAFRHLHIESAFRTHLLDERFQTTPSSTHTFDVQRIKPKVVFWPCRSKTLESELRGCDTQVAPGILSNWKFVDIKHINVVASPIHSRVLTTQPKSTLVILANNSTAVGLALFDLFLRVSHQMELRNPS
jgi:hypothetical protein